MSDFCLMAPKGDGYSTFSDEDFATFFAAGLIAPFEITPQIAGQWLFNVKSFRDYTVFHEEAGDRIVDRVNTAVGDLKSNPPLNFENLYDRSLLVVNSENKFRYTTPSLVGANLALQGYFFFKHRTKWYFGIGNYVTEEGAKYEFSATMNEIQINAIQTFDFGHVDFDQTLTILSTFY